MKGKGHTPRVTGVVRKGGGGGKIHNKEKTKKRTMNKNGRGASLYSRWMEGERRGFGVVGHLNHSST